MEIRRICGTAIALSAFAALPAWGGIVHLTGDFGTADYFGPNVSNPGPSTSVPFLQNVVGRGSLSGDLVSTNTGGTQFSLVITNMVFQAFDWAPDHQTQIRLIASENFAVTSAGPHIASQSVSGVTGSTGGGGLIICNAVHEITVNLPTISYGSPNGNTQPFSVPPVFANVVSSPPFYSIQMQLDLVIDGDGFIHLPNSFETGAIAVPASGPVTLLGLTGLIAMRRRRV